MGTIRIAAEDSQGWSSQEVKADPLSIRQAFNVAWPIFKTHFAIFAAVLLTTFGAWVLLEIVVIAGQRFGILLWTVAHLAFLIFVGGVEVGFLRICLGLSHGREPQYADIFADLNLGPKFLGWPDSLSANGYDWPAALGSPRGLPCCSLRPVRFLPSRR